MHTRSEKLIEIKLDCCKCSSDDYDLCQACYDIGKRCMNPKHSMRLRVIADGIESYAEYTTQVSELRWPPVRSKFGRD